MRWNTSHKLPNNLKLFQQALAHVSKINHSLPLKRKKKKKMTPFFPVWWEPRPQFVEALFPVAEDNWEVAALELNGGVFVVSC